MYRLLFNMNEEEAKIYSSNGAHVVLRPFDDASEEAADSLTEAMHLLPENIDWPLALKEIRLRKSSVFAGQLIRILYLREVAGISILAVSRAGRVHLDPDPDFQLFPGDRLVLMGEPSALRHAEDILQETDDGLFDDEPRRFATAELEVDAESLNLGCSLAEMKFRKTYGATVIGIKRGHQRIPMPRSDECLKQDDRLIVIGTPDSIEKIKKTRL